MIKELNDKELENVSGGDIYHYRELKIHLVNYFAGDIISTLRNVYVVAPDNSNLLDPNSLDFIFFDLDDAVKYAESKGYSIDKPCDPYFCVRPLAYLSTVKPLEINL